MNIEASCSGVRAAVALAAEVDGAGANLLIQAADNALGPAREKGN